MALGLGLVFLLVHAVLFGVAVVLYFHSTHLSLPISSAVTILTALLPIISFLNSFIHPSLLHSARTSSNPFLRLSPTVLQTLQGLLTTVLATLLFERVVPSDTVECLMNNQWLGLWRDRNGEAIRLIQDTLNCCGLNSLKDRAYPISDPKTCAAIFGRDQACRGPWRSALRGSAGADFGIVIAVGVLQALGLLMTREGTNWWTAWRSVSWHRQQQVSHRESRPLLAGIPDADADVDEVVEQQEESARPRGYQSLTHNTDEENRPRVEPSAIRNRQEVNVWESDN
ncbi:tetraspanin [Trichoderma gamsii]|uniref:Tetraspanin n=1 Tax=Trichoderma gamsii TaxID=398673 RepID=A0A2P4ZET8_9HYPO|nr:tetraspanin [Trichoderma gamsii]PON22802.1 tetraspanin [Trichoderma gamsii]